MPYKQAFLKGREYLAKTAAISALWLAPMAAVWAQAPAYTLQVIRSSHGHVSSISNPAPVFSGQIACGPQFAQCHTTYHPDTNVTLTATPAQGFKFDGWGTPQGTVNLQNCEYTVGNECYVTMRGETTIAALFSPATSTGGVCQSREFSEAEETMLDAYIAYYGRPPDVPGLAGWVGQLQRPDLHRDSVLSMFGESPEYQQRFGGTPNRELINNLYKQIFGRGADAAGLDFYEILLTSGRPLATIAMEILAGALNDDAVVLENRRKVARHYVTVSAGMRVRAGPEEISNLLSLVNLETDPNNPNVRLVNPETISKISQKANSICTTYTDLLF